MERNKEILEKLKSNISTVDAFQGDERSIVFVSLTRSRTEEGSIGFLDEKNRFNVAFSRAEDEVIVVGSLNTLINLNTDNDSAAYFEKARSVVEKFGRVDVLPAKKKKKRGSRGRGGKVRAKSSAA